MTDKRVVDSKNPNFEKILRKLDQDPSTLEHTLESLSQSSVILRDFHENVSFHEARLRPYLNVGVARQVVLLTPTFEEKRPRPS